jgi:hypothetical protein
MADDAAITAEIASFLEPRGKRHCAPLIASAFKAAAYPAEEWIEALIQMSAETLQELLNAVSDLLRGLFARSSLAFRSLSAGRFR